MKIPLHIWVAVSSWVSKAGSVLAQLLVIPMLSKALSPGEFAAYAIIASLLAWYQLADLGFGNSVQNHIAENQTHQKPIGGFISAVTVVGFSIVLLAIPLLYLGANTATQLLLGRLELSPAAQSPLVFFWSGLFMVANAVGTMSLKTLYALNKGVMANAITLFNSLAMLLLVALVVQTVSTEHLFLAIVIACFAPMGISGMALLLYFGLSKGTWQWNDIKDHFSIMRFRAVRFLLFAFMAACVLNVDYLVMSQTLPAEEIATYNILFRIFWVGMALYSGLLSATLPVFVAFGVRQDQESMRRYMRLYIGCGFAFVFILGLIMSVRLSTIIDFLAPGLTMQPSLTTLFLFCIYIAFRIWTDTYAVALQALSEIGIFIKVTPLQAAISIPAQILFSLRWGLDGILMGIILSFLLSAAWILPWKLRLHWNQEKHQSPMLAT